MTLLLNCKNVRPIMEKVFGLNDWMLIESIPNIDEMTIEIYKEPSIEVLFEIGYCIKLLSEEFDIIEEVNKDSEKNLYTIIIKQKELEEIEFLQQELSEKLEELKRIYDKYSKELAKLKKIETKIDLVQEEINLINEKLCD